MLGYKRNKISLQLKLFAKHSLFEILRYFANICDNLYYFVVLNTFKIYFKNLLICRSFVTYFLLFLQNRGLGE